MDRQRKQILEPRIKKKAEKQKTSPGTKELRAHPSLRQKYQLWGMLISGWIPDVSLFPLSGSLLHSSLYNIQRKAWTSRKPQWLIYHSGLIMTLQSCVVLFPVYPMTVMVLARSSLNSVGIHQNVSMSTLEIQEAECCGHWMWSNWYSNQIRRYIQIPHGHTMSELVHFLE